MITILVKILLEFLSIEKQEESGLRFDQGSQFIYCDYVCFLSFNHFFSYNKLFWNIPNRFLRELPSNERLNFKINFILFICSRFSFFLEICWRNGCDEVQKNFYKQLKPIRSVYWVLAYTFWEIAWTVHLLEQKSKANSGRNLLLSIFSPLPFNFLKILLYYCFFSLL